MMENKPEYNRSFPEAMLALVAGKSCQRKGWNGGGMQLRAQFPDKQSKMTHPYLYMVIPGCEEGTRRLPWQPAQVDLFAHDWAILD